MARPSKKQSDAMRATAHKAWLACGRPGPSQMARIHPEWTRRSLARWIKMWLNEDEQEPKKQPKKARIQSVDDHISPAQRLQQHGEEAIQGLAELASDPATPPSVRLSAHKEFLNRSGWMPPKRGTPHPSDGVSQIAQYEEEARALMKRLSTARLRVLRAVYDETTDEAIVERWALEVGE